MSASRSKLPDDAFLASGGAGPAGPSSPRDGTTGTNADDSRWWEATRPPTAARCWWYEARNRPLLPEVPADGGLTTPSREDARGIDSWRGSSRGRGAATTPPPPPPPPPSPAPLIGIASGTLKNNQTNSRLHLITPTIPSSRPHHLSTELACSNIFIKAVIYQIICL